MEIKGKRKSKKRKENIGGKNKEKQKSEGQGISPSYPCDTGILSKHSILLFLQLLSLFLLLIIMNFEI
jgi:hypothetical protein